MLISSRLAQPWMPATFTKRATRLRQSASARPAERRHGERENLCASVLRGPWGAVRGIVAVALRRFRFPVIARVRVEDGRPARVVTDRAGMAGGRVETCAGPWRTSGAWCDGGRQARRDMRWGPRRMGRHAGRRSAGPTAEVRASLREAWSAKAWFVEGIVD